MRLCCSQAELTAEDNMGKEVEIFRRARNRTMTFCNGLRATLKQNRFDDKAMQKYLDSQIHFERTEFDEPFSVTGLDCVLMLIKGTPYKYALTVKQLPEICDLVASQPDRFRNNSDISPSDINRTGLRDFHVEPKFCKDRFAYTFPRYILDRGQRLL